MIYQLICSFNYLTKSRLISLVKSLQLKESGEEIHGRNSTRMCGSGRFHVESLDFLHHLRRLQHPKGNEHMKPGHNCKMSGVETLV